MTFYFDASTRPREKPLRFIVLHWSAGIGEPLVMARRMASKRLSVHFAIGVAGDVVQLASLDRLCAHASGVNDRSIGIEVVSPGLPGPLREREKAQGVERTVYTAKLRGSRRTLLDYTTAQAAAVETLVDDLCGELGVPRRVPVDARGVLIARQLTAAELGAFEGVIGHFHAHRNKLDPGTAPLDRLRARWAA